MWAAALVAVAFVPPALRPPAAATVYRPPLIPPCDFATCAPLFTTRASKVRLQSSPESQPPASKSIDVPITATAIAVVLSLVTVKTLTDLMTNYVTRPPAISMALVTVLAIIPLTALWFSASNTAIRLRRRLRGADLADDSVLRSWRVTYREAWTDAPGRMNIIGFAYALDMMFYFFVQSNVGVVTYTVLAQTKIFFTIAVLRLRGMLGKLQPAQKLGLLSLFLGANLVALKDVATGVASTTAGANRALGVGGLVLSQAIAALANVAYEKRLREPGDVWVRNVQINFFILSWLVAFALVYAAGLLAAGGALPTAASLLAAFGAPWVWLVVTLKATSALLIAMTIKAGGNVLYSISKPWPVVLATLATCITLGQVPSIGFVAGIALSLSGIALYYMGKK